MVLHPLADLCDVGGGCPLPDLSPPSCDIPRSFKSRPRLAGDHRRVGRVSRPGGNVPLFLDSCPRTFHQDWATLLHDPRSDPMHPISLFSASPG